MKTQIENFKMKVTPQQSERVQEVCFRHGVKWPFGSEKIDTEKDYLFFKGSSLTHSCSLSTFEMAGGPEITYDQFMAKYAPENGELLTEQHNAYHKSKCPKVEAKPVKIKFAPGDIVKNGDAVGKVVWVEEPAVIGQRDGLLFGIELITGSKDYLPCVDSKGWEKCGIYSIPEKIKQSHLATALRIFGPSTDVDSITKIVNIVLDNVELFEKIEGLENEFNHPKN